MPFLSRNDNQSQARYAAPAAATTATIGAPATASTAAPPAVAAAIAPFRLATTLLRCTSELTKVRLHHGLPAVKPRGRRDTASAGVGTQPFQGGVCASIGGGPGHANSWICYPP